jgi:hemerythrin-like domain-containing protein
MAVARGAGAIMRNDPRRAPRIPRLHGDSVGTLLALRQRDSAGACWAVALRNKCKPIIDEGDPMKATELLKEQHRDLLALLDCILADACDIPTIMDELAKRLLAHMLVEEVVLFPEVFALNEVAVRKAAEEHAVARFELRRALVAGLADPNRRAKLTMLKELIKHHIDEEEQELLPRAEKELPPMVNERLGQQMEELFAVLVIRSHQNGTSAHSPATELIL